MWHLPLSRALLYYHCALRSSGAWTVPAEDVDAKLAATEAALATIAKLEAEALAEDDGGDW